MLTTCRSCAKGLRAHVDPPGPIRDLTDRGWAEHMAAVHHAVVLRPGETVDDAQRRFLVGHPEARQCKLCRRAGQPWAPRRGKG